ncbi:hypothetical protein JUN65_00050 [Gluconacetobacter azotocaptans]|uniref:hypothetical protein n=1 Tax=Gluconacetobacter azotocaptans TaxID=142834 RepID=UPI00195B79AF|nr:hypothetical protein [Gluconacetobacter azotocaptans]MBM9399993.1 hypothetical protein [Gluconacetobacter azotocaptans]
MTDDERQLLILVATYLANRREDAVRTSRGGELAGHATADINRLRALVAKVESQAERDAATGADSDISADSSPSMERAMSDRQTTNPADAKREQPVSITETSTPTEITFNELQKKSEGSGRRNALFKCLLEEIDGLKAYYGCLQVFLLGSLVAKAEEENDIEIVATGVVNQERQLYRQKYADKIHIISSYSLTGHSVYTRDDVVRFANSRNDYNRTRKTTSLNQVVEITDIWSNIPS